MQNIKEESKTPLYRIVYLGKKRRKNTFLAADIISPILVAAKDEFFRIIGFDSEEEVTESNLTILDNLKNLYKINYTARCFKIPNRNYYGLIFRRA